MSQNRQYTKTKTYRVLKVFFYMLGLPLFIGVVFCSAVKFIGHDPFGGTANLTGKLGFFMGYEQLLTSKALYGVYVAFAIWLFVSIVHIILAKCVKNPRARMIAVVALLMVIMLGGALVMDAVFDAKITELQENAPAGVTVDDYKRQLSYYRTISTNGQGKNDTKNLINKITQLENVYNVAMEGANFSGAAGNISNKPISYYNIVADDGTVGIDIAFRYDDERGQYVLDIDDQNNIVADGNFTKEVEGSQLVRIAPNENGELFINGQVYSHYAYYERFTKWGDSIYTWYTKEMFPLGTTFDKGQPNGSEQMMDGVYGTGVYNRSGLLGDGYAYSLYNVLDILEAYYSSQAIISELDPTGIVGKQLRMTADYLREDYYNGLEVEGMDPISEDEIDWYKAMFNQEVDMNARFSLTRGELDFLLAKVGALLGENSLFDFLLKLSVDEHGELVSGLDGVLGKFGLNIALGPILKTLNDGMSLGALINNADTMATVANVLKAATGCPESVEINDLFILVSYAGATDGMGVNRDKLFVAVVKDGGVQDGEGKWIMGTDTRKVANGGDVLLDLDFSDVVLDAENSDYAFDLDHLSLFLNTAVNGILKYFNFDLKKILVDNTIGKLIGGLILKDIEMNGKTYKGLIISGFSVPLFDKDYNMDVDIVAILMNLLDGLYSYQSSIFMPAWEFYECQRIEADETAQRLAKAYADYDRSSYIINVHSKMIGSALTGDNLGAGTYPSSFGLNDLQSVQQVKWDLMYKPTFYPLYALRDMMLFFGAFVIFLYFMSFVAHEKELEYGTGERLPMEGRIAKRKKAKLAKQAQKEQEANADSATVQPEGVNADGAPVVKDGTAVPVDQNTGKEVL